MTTVKKFINSILKLIFPVECLNCGRENYYLCDNCLKKILVQPTLAPFDHPLTHLDGVLTATNYHENLIAQTIHYFKFRFIQALAEPLAGLLIDFVKKIDFDLKNSLVIPVPLNKKRLLERGFNQSYLLAKIFAEHFNLPLSAEVVSRSRNTPHQVGLNQKQRRLNINNAFTLNLPEAVRNKNIILIDDVVTTGATLEEIAKLLKTAGAKTVHGLTVAKD
ncbi:MAG TPA: hypothetical protein DD697_01720 [Candidatus Komeilibacteria bacterium]|nr:hypothetical protein [Candidatus Komeilibacteria bacterium]